MQAVFRFLEDLVRVRLEHLGRDLLLAVSGQAVLHHAARLGGGEQLVVHLIALERLHAHFLLGLHAHRRPSVRDDHVRVLRGLHRVVGEEEVRVALCKGEHVRVRAVALGGRDRDLHAGLEAADDQRVRHVVAVADVAHLEALEHRELLADGHQVSQHLAGMAEIGQAVDDRDHAEALALQRAVRDIVLLFIFELIGKVEQADDLLGRAVEQLE